MSLNTKAELEQLGAEQAQLVKEVQAMASTVRSRKDNPDFTGEEKQEFSLKTARIEEIDKRVDTLNCLSKAEQYLKPESEIRSLGKTTKYSIEPSEQDKHDAFKGWLLQGVEEKENSTHRRDSYVRAAQKCGMDLKQNEMHIRSAQTVGTASAGGDVATINLLQSLTTAMINWDGVRKVARIVPTANGSPLPYPLLNDTGNVGRLVTEGSAFTPTAMVFGTKSIGAYKFCSDSVTISTELLEDSAVPIESVIGEALGIRLGQIQNQKFTKGSGSGEPEGIVTTAHTGVTTASPTAFTYNELIALKRSVLDIYQPNAKWLVSRDFWTKVMLMVDDNGRPLLNSSLQGISEGYGYTLLGDPVVINYAMDACTAGNTPALYGDFSYFVIRDVASTRLVRLNELYAANDLVGFAAWVRGSSGAVTAASSYPYQAMVMAAS